MLKSSHLSQDIEPEEDGIIQLITKVDNMWCEYLDQSWLYWELVELKLTVSADVESVFTGW